MNFTLNTSEHNRTRISKMLMALFECWCLSPEEQSGLLGCSKENYKQLARYRQGAPLDNDQALLERAAILLNIHRTLRLLFPHNRNLAYVWMTTPNRSFNGLAPTMVIQEQGIKGLYMVQAYLDRQLIGP